MESVWDSGCVRQEAMAIASLEELEFGAKFPNKPGKEHDRKPAFS